MSDQEKDTYNGPKTGEKSNGGLIAVLIVAVLAVVIVLGVMAKNNAPMKKAADGQANVAASNAANRDAAESASTEPAADAQAAEGEAAQEPIRVSDDMVIEPGNPVVAKVGDEEIMRSDVLQFISQLPPQMQQTPIQNLYPLALEQVISARVIDQKDELSSLANDEEVQAQVEEAREQIVRNIYIQREVDARMNDDMLQRLYNDQIANLPDVEEMSARHILVETEAEAADIITQINDGGDFAALATQHSLDTGTAENGGDLGYFTPADMVPEFSEAVAKLDEGAVSTSPVQTQFGWHVIKLEDKRVRPKPTMEEATPFLQTQARRQILNDLLEDWRKDAKVVEYDINGKPVENNG